MQYLAQLAPRISIGDSPGTEDIYLHLLISILKKGHSWSAPLKPIFMSGDSDEFVREYLVDLRSRLKRAKYPNSSTAVPFSWQPLGLENLMLASGIHISRSRMFILTNAGTGLYGQKDGPRPSWVPDYDAIARLSERVSSSFEIEVPWWQKHYAFDFFLEGA